MTYTWQDRVVDYNDLSEAEREELLLVMPPDGRLLILNLPNEVYHRSTAVSFSSLKRLLKSAWSFKHGGDVETTGAMAFGTLCHEALLEPNRLNEANYVFLPQDEKGKDMVRNKAHKAYQEFLQEAGERQVVKRSDWDAARELALSVHAHPAFKAWMRSDADHTAEVSIFWTDPTSGVWCRCRPDLLTIPRDAVLPITCWDLKTTKDSSYQAVQFFGEKYGQWPLAASFYAEGQRQFFQREVSFNLIAADKTAEQEVNIYQYEAGGTVTPIAQIGRGMVRNLLDRLAVHLETDTWPRQSEGIANMEPSSFLSRLHEPDLDPEPF